MGITVEELLVSAPMFVGGCLALGALLAAVMTIQFRPSLLRRRRYTPEPPPHCAACGRQNAHKDILFSRQRREDICEVCHAWFVLRGRTIPTAAFSYNPRRFQQLPRTRWS